MPRTQDRGPRRNLSPEHVRRQIKDINLRLLGDKKKSVPPEQMDDKTRLAYLGILAKLAKILGDRDRAVIAGKKANSAFS